MAEDSENTLDRISPNSSNSKNEEKKNDDSKDENKSQDDVESKVQVALTNIRDQLIGYGLSLTSKPIGKGNYFESYVKEGRKSHNDDDHVDALIHKHKYYSSSDFFLLFNFSFFRTGFAVIKPYYVAKLNKKTCVIVSIGIKLI